MDVTIRQMTADDLAEVLWIEERSFTVAWSRRSFAYELDSDIAISMVASKADSVIGYICVHALLDLAYILKLAVHPGLRRQNVATLLIDHTLKALHAMSCEKVLLEVRRSNELAMRLYERFGFKRLSVRKDYYTDPTEDAITMILNVSTPANAKYVLLWGQGDQSS
ncbi:MAG: ribosomal protein S18-alanine N-acetyltransferase [Nitrospirae bacterium]|nr:ribosomal protein S18-alanine N-acetyltransferase [Nitrospirota bacterium]MBF0591968.1 ribosomal protein S18-alanine N-acetyltransferase [Nitrospirota bacterium]